MVFKLKLSSARRWSGTNAPVSWGDNRQSFKLQLQASDILHHTTPSVERGDTISVIISYACVPQYSRLKPYVRFQDTSSFPVHSLQSHISTETARGRFIHTRPHPPIANGFLVILNQRRSSRHSYALPHPQKSPNTLKGSVGRVPSLVSAHP